MNLKLLGAVTLLGAGTAETTASAQAVNCEIHVYPAAGVHSVGDDFDNVHEVDQDLHHYYQMAGRPLDWLTPARQLELLRQAGIAAAAGLSGSPVTLHSEPLSRGQALEPGARISGDGCVIEILFPQIFLERGALATRSLRVFGIVRRFEARAPIQSYSGYASAPMAGFQMRSPADSAAATQIVESAYVQAVETMLRNSTKTKK